MEQQPAAPHEREPEQHPQGVLGRERPSWLDERHPGRAGGQDAGEVAVLDQEELAARLDARLGRPVAPDRRLPVQTNVDRDGVVFDRSEEGAERRQDDQRFFAEHGGYSSGGARRGVQTFCYHESGFINRIGEDACGESRSSGSA